MSSERYAVIEAGIVTNIIVWNGNTATWSPPPQVVTVPLPSDSMVTIGATYDGETFSNPDDGPPNA